MNSKKFKPFYAASSITSPIVGSSIRIFRIMYNPYLCRYVLQDWKTSDILECSKISDNLFLAQTAYTSYFVFIYNNNSFVASSLYLPHEGALLPISYCHKRYDSFFLTPTNYVFVKKTKKLCDHLYLVSASNGKTFVVCSDF